MSGHGTGNGKGKRVAVVSGVCLVAVLGFSLVFWKDLVARYHLLRLKRDVAYVLGLHRKPEGTPECMAIHAFLEERSHRIAFLRFCLERALDVLEHGDSPPWVKVAIRRSSAIDASQTADAVQAYRRGRFMEAGFAATAWETVVELRLVTFAGTTTRVRRVAADGALASLYRFFRVFDREEPIDLPGAGVAHARPLRRSAYAPALRGAESDLIVEVPFEGNPYLLETLRSQDGREVRGVITTLLRRNARPMLEGLLRTLFASGDPESRTAAAYAVHELREDVLDWLPELGKTLADRDLVVRRATARVLSSWATPAMGAATDALLGALNDADVVVRARAVAALGGIGDGRDAVASALTHALADVDWVVRYQAIQALGELHPAPTMAVEALERLRAEEDSVLTFHLRRTLNRIRHPKHAGTPADAATEAHHAK